MSPVLPTASLPKSMSCNCYPHRSGSGFITEARGGRTATVSWRGQPSAPHVSSLPRRLRPRPTTNWPLPPRRRPALSAPVFSPAGTGAVLASHSSSIRLPRITDRAPVPGTMTRRSKGPASAAELMLQRTEPARKDRSLPPRGTSQRFPRGVWAPPGGQFPDAPKALLTDRS